MATIEAAWAAYEAGAPEFFDFFTEGASIFPLSSRVRLVGREAYRRYCGEEFEEQRRAVQILNPEVHLLGESAVATYHERIRLDSRSVDSRVTLLLVPHPPGSDLLKIAHMHMSPLTSPGSTELRGLVEDITLLRSSAKPAS